jgi:PAS domain-containing protein
MRNIQKVYGETNTGTSTVTRDYSDVINHGLIEETPALMLNDDGIITDCNGACADLLGCATKDITSQHISKFLPQMQEAMLFNNHHLNPQLRFLSHIGHHFQAIRNDGSFFFSKVFFVELGNKYESFIRVIIRPIQLENVYS